MITIVSGLPRSGTSLMMQMLAVGGMELLADGVREPDEDNPRGYFEFEPVKRTREDPSWLARAEGKAVKMVYQLLYDLPPGRDYRVILMERELSEIVDSQNRMLERLGRQPGRLDNAEWVRVFRRDIAKLKRWMATRSDFRVQRVSYNRLIVRPKPALKRIRRLLDGPLDVEKMAAAVDPALYRHRKRG